MADTKISALASRTSLATTDQFLNLAGGVNYRSPLSSLSTLLASTFLADAPSDGNIYGRKDATWVESPTGGLSNIGEWTFNATPASPPSSGQIRLNNATQSSATVMWMSGITALSKDVINFLVNVVKLNDEIYLQDKTDGTKYQIWRVTGAITDNTTYIDIPIVWERGGGTILHGQRVLFTMIRQGSITPGDVTGPASATDNALVRFDLTTGKLIQNSTATLSGAGLLAATSITEGGTALSSKYETLGILAGVNTQTASYTLVAGDIGKAVEMNVASANNLTVPPNSSVAFATGSRIDITQMGAGQTTVVAGSGVTIRQRETKLKLAGQYAGASLYKRATDEWVLFGDLST
jgi:hypothetical protein